MLLLLRLSLCSLLRFIVNFVCVCVSYWLNTRKVMLKNWKADCSFLTLVKFRPLNDELNINAQQYKLWVFINNSQPYRKKKSLEISKTRLHYGFIRMRYISICVRYLLAILIFYRQGSTLCNKKYDHCLAMNNEIDMCAVLNNTFTNQKT